MEQTLGAEFASKKSWGCGLQGSAVCGWRNGGEGGLEHRGDLLPVEQRVEQDEQAYDWGQWLVQCLSRWDPIHGWVVDQTNLFLPMQLTSRFGWCWMREKWPALEQVRPKLLFAPNKALKGMQCTFGGRIHLGTHPFLSSLCLLYQEFQNILKANMKLCNCMQCDQFFIRGHFCKNPGGIRADFQQKSGQNPGKNPGEMLICKEKNLFYFVSKNKNWAKLYNFSEINNSFWGGTITILCNSQGLHMV